MPLHIFDIIIIMRTQGAFSVCFAEQSICCFLTDGNTWFLGHIRSLLRFGYIQDVFAT